MHATYTIPAYSAAACTFPLAYSRLHSPTCTVPLTRSHLPQGIGFVEFENELQSGVAMSGLQGFKITPTNLMQITYAKR